MTRMCPKKQSTIQAIMFLAGMIVFLGAVVAACIAIANYFDKP